MALRKPATLKSPRFPRRRLQAALFYARQQRLERGGGGSILWLVVDNLDETASVLQSPNGVPTTSTFTDNGDETVTIS